MPTGYSKLTGQNPFKGKKRPPFSAEHRRKISKAGKGKHQSPNTEWKKGFTPPGSILFEKGRIAPNKGVPLTEEVKIKLRKALKGRKVWNKGLGNKTPLNKKIRKSLRYKRWRHAVFKRDNWTCVWCQERGGELNADHIKPFAYFPELRFKISNGRTLCKPCHRKTDTYGTNIKKWKQSKQQ